MDMELELTSVGGKVGAGAGQPVARLTITGLASTPVDHDTKNNNTLLITGKHYFIKLWNLNGLYFRTTSDLRYLSISIEYNLKY